MICCLLQKWYDGFRSRSLKYYYGREERPNTEKVKVRQIKTNINLNVFIFDRYTKGCLTDMLPESEL